ncbi:MAG: mandelate racemase/muconate lactonizing enzyme family protein [Acidimicrobiia bacterium]|nr:mandelate racemase/muconate lactonizing enzyme family protein [Acidimicrobiia bacterium]
MIIAGIETLPLRIPFKPGTRSAASAWGPKDLAAVDSLLVKVTTDQGCEGWGEAFGFTATPVTQRAIDELITPLCVGQDATHIIPLMRDVQEKLHVFGRGGPLSLAWSAVDIALWDIAGKAAGAPLHRLLGGGAADLVCYASLDAYSDSALVRAGVRQALDAGFRSIKLHEKELPVVHAARAEAGPDVALMLDVNCAWTVDQALAKAAELRAIRLKWLEEPVWPPENYDGLARLRRTSGIPIAAGENVPALMDFDRLMGAEAVDFVQPSPAKMGGVTELVKVFSAAALRNITVMPHTFYEGPGLLAGIHVSAVHGTADTMIEWRFFDLQAHIYGSALTPEDGRIQVPQGPGLGIDPDPGVIHAYLRT